MPDHDPLNREIDHIDPRSKPTTVKHPTSVAEADILRWQIPAFGAIALAALLLSAMGSTHSGKATEVDYIIDNIGLTLFGTFDDYQSPLLITIAILAIFTQATVAVWLLAKTDKGSDL